MTPLRAEDGRLLGFTKITQDLTERKQTEEDLEERVRERTRQLHESEAQLRQMASRLTMAEQEERHRLSQLLHDDLQQLLYGIQLRLDFVNEGLQSGQGEDLLAHAQEVSTWIEDAITITRRLTVDLSPPVLQGEGLTDALEWLAPQMAETHGLQVKLEAEHGFLTEEEDMRVLLFQIIRELLFNVVKHAETNRARVALREEAGQLVIQVSDMGRGFAPAGTDRSQGFGLFNIRERLGLFGGRLKIDSKPGEGTQVTVTIPIKQKKR
jgi:signal transduction histidine kinase